MNTDPSIVIPQITYSSAPAVEVRILGDGKRISIAQMVRETEELNKTVQPGFIWRQETTHEKFALRSPLTHTNAKGAHSHDESIEPGPYWTSEETPWCEGRRVVVGFGFGYVTYSYDGFRAFARVVRVASQ